MSPGERKEAILKEGRMTERDIVLLGMDAMRISMGMRPINFDADVVASFIWERAKQLQEPAELRNLTVRDT